MTFLNRDGIALYHDLSPGDGPPVVFLHGWCCDHSFFAPQLAFFRQLGRQTLALDFRGHGLSDKPEQAYSIRTFADDVEWMCRKLSLVRPLLIGHSMGGIVAYDLAARLPDLVGAFVMIDSAVVLPKAAKTALPAAISELRSKNYEDALREIVTRSFFISTDDASRREAILRLMSSTPQHVMVEALEGLLDYNPQVGRGRVGAPSLYIAADEPGARSDLTGLRDLLHGMHEGRIVGSGHFCTLEVPDQINAMIERFEQITRVALVAM